MTSEPRTPAIARTHSTRMQHIAAASNCNTRTRHHAAFHAGCNTLQLTATHCNMLKLTATHCNTLQHTATHCNTLQHTLTLSCCFSRTNLSVTFEPRTPEIALCRLPSVLVCFNVLQCAAVSCSKLQCVAVCCSELQCVAECVAVYCSVLQCVARTAA